MIIMEIDIHGLRQDEAVAKVEKALGKCGKETMVLRVIHGYHGGTALQKRIRSRFSGHDKVKRIELGLNAGQTDLILK